jgi:hypothetical protein
MNPKRFGLPTWPGLPWQRLFPYLFLGFSVLWTTIAALSTFGGWAGIWLAESRGQVSVVEGPIENFHPMPYGGHDTERFTVADVHFAYSDYAVTPGFNQTSSHGGPIREGLQVRITYTGPTSDAMIVKLQIACSPQSTSGAQLVQVRLLGDQTPSAAVVQTFGWFATATSVPTRHSLAMKEMSVTEQRYKAVLAVIADGRTVTNCCGQPDAKGAPLR